MLPGYRSVARGRRSSVVALVFALACAAGGVRSAHGAPSTEECLACHGNKELVGSDGRSPFISADLFADSVHGALECAGCHEDAVEIPHADRLKPVPLDTCGGCHDDAVTRYREGIHATVADGHAVAGCANCHGEIHRAFAHTDERSAAHWTHLTERCATCHADRSLVERFSIPVVQPVEAYRLGVHGRAVSSGTRAAICSDCHGSHEIRRGADPRSTIWRNHVPDTCGKCHEAIADKFRQSVHGQALAQGVKSAPVCTDCHGEHQILSISDPASPVFASNIPVDTCGRCHGDARLSAKYGIPGGNLAAFQDSFHGLALRAGRTRVANCASCHGVHDILPSSDPRSMVNAANLPTVCGKCHPGAGSHFPLGQVHLLTAGSPTRAEYWIRLGYLWAIVLVVGFMLLHNGWDLAIKARHWPPPPRPTPTHVSERMSRSLRWQHGLVMLSFPVLVYTGFALTYPESWWAAPLLRWESRFGLRGIIHRAAAVVLLAALGWHAVQLAVSRRLRAQLRGLLPTWDDARQLALRLAYYAGRRRTLPPTGPFSYIEKMEYWAFIWGMMIMTATGMPLWFSDFTLRWVPKWVADVATAIHFYEAVLATLAILVWHLYWVIFDPEVYPMDWSWWHGRSPASREHERLDEDGSDPPAHVS